MISVAILGGSGYTAVELIKLLLRHPEVSLKAVTTRQEGTPLLSDLHPSLTNRIHLRCENLDIGSIQKLGIQCVFSCLPHTASMESIPSLLQAGFRVVDLSADYRLKNLEVYTQWYGEKHIDPENLAQAVYGLPEVYRDKIKKANLIANPGCYPQTAIMGLLPLIRGGYIETKGIIIDSKSGVSGAGRTPKLSTLYPECNESVSAYSIGNHRHTPEIEQILSDGNSEPVEVIFTPHLMPMDRGIFSTIYAKPKKEWTTAELQKLYRDFYKAEPFIRVRDNLPATKDSAYTNYLDIAVRSVRGMILILASEDNLIRGASGVALQNFNIMYGLPETMALI